MSIIATHLNLIIKIAPANLTKVILKVTDIKNIV